MNKREETSTDMLSYPDGVDTREIVHDSCNCPKCGLLCIFESVSAKEWAGSDNPDYFWARIRGVINCKSCGRSIMKLFLSAPRDPMWNKNDEDENSSYLKGYKQGVKDAQMVTETMAKCLGGMR